MNSVQAFLLEVIVERLDLHEKAKTKGKTVGFSEFSAGALATSSKLQIVGSNKLFPNSTTNVRMMDERKKSLPPPCSVTITFGDLAPIVINEDPPGIGKDLKDKETKEQQNPEFEAEKEKEDRAHARAAGLSVFEYQRSKRKNPELLTEKKLSKGKSCLIRMRPTEMIHLLSTEKLNLVVEGGWTFSMNLGTAAVELPSEFTNAVILAAYSSSMREMIAREGHIWWPPHLYRSKMIKDVREAQMVLEEKKKNELSKEEQDLAVRFKNLCDLPPMPKPCKMCELNDDPCNTKPIKYADLAPPKKTKKKKQKIDRKGPAWLMYPSPDPIKPPPLPTFGQTTEVVDILDETKSPTVIVSLFVRLSCFGNALELKRQFDPFPFPS